MTVTALIVAAGSGSRMGGAIPKQFRPIAGKAVLTHAVDALASHRAIDTIRVVIGDGQQELARAVLGDRDVGELIIGGDERADSVRLGLAAIEADVILVHDAARPFCPHDVIDRLLEALQHAEGAVPVLPLADTVARAGQMLGDPVDRSDLVRVQTPQAFHFRSLVETYAQWNGPSPTDESTVLRAAGREVAVVAGDPKLEKLTTAADWQRAENWLNSSLVSRTGLGFDVHAFSSDGPIMMGGVSIPHS
ncbi:MAG TPA: 2-C-methyl-D-erythritol 4-phosphate cytidylyltransferase, partial [Sphingomicrobium sp.]|nr:2-C-methyl-D-erythritol 4-phosphate cytidylyltransferase [Sphingomicrobium sp.]